VRSVRKAGNHNRKEVGKPFVSSAVPGWIGSCQSSFFKPRFVASTLRRPAAAQSNHLPMYICRACVV
jgi:hypothetical protein